MATDRDFEVQDLFVERVSSAAVLHAMRDEWDALWTSIPSRTPFQSSAWLLPWWDIFGSGEAQVFLFRKSGRLVGFVPMYQAKSDAGCEMRLIGAGVSDYLDLLAAPGTEPLVSEALKDVLEADAEWDVCHFDHLRPGSPLLSMTTLASQNMGEVAEEPCPVTPLPASRSVQNVFGNRLNK